MESNLNLTKLIGIFRYLAETVGDLSRIRYKDGNEEKLSHIIENVKDYLVLKDYLVDNKTNPKYSNELENILALLIVNTGFKDASDLSNIKQFSHFLKAFPLLSKFVFVNIIIELDLVKQCCSLILTLPYTVGQEIFDEFVSCSKQCEPPKLLSDSNVILETIIKMLSNLDLEPNGNIIDKLGDTASEILKNVSCINEDWAHKMKTRKVHEHMGYTLFNFFKLLRSCPLHTPNLNRIIQALVDVSIKLMMLVTINVFCTWAEVKHENDQPMQIVIASEAYMVIEHLQKKKSAKDLIEMLGPMARKPKTINEIILESDIETIIANIDKGGENQKLWLRGLVNSNVFKNEESMKCLDKWAHLCTQDDIMRLLSLSVHYKEPQIKLLVLKCAKALSVQELEFISTRYFCEYNTTNLDMGSINQELAFLINKAQSGSEVDDEFIKNLYMLLLQNPETVLLILYSECVKTGTYTNYLKRAFVSIKTAVEVIRGLTKDTFIKVLKSNPPTTKSIICYKSLLNMLIELNYFHANMVLEEIFKSRLEEFLSDNDYEKLLCMLQLLNAISLEFVLQEGVLDVIAVLTKTLEMNRCTVLNFSIIQQNIVQEVIEFLLKYSSSLNKLQHNVQYKDYLSKLEMKDLLTKYHITSLYTNHNNCFLSYVCPQFKFTGTGEDVCTLIKILPTCIGLEWVLAAKEMDAHFNNYETLLSSLEKMLILLSQTTAKIKNQPTQIPALKYCLQHYCNIVENFLRPKYSTLDEEVSLIKSVCNILKCLPECLTKTKGLQLISLLSVTALRSLIHDKRFVLSLAALDVTYSQRLAQKMLSND